MSKIYLVEGPVGSGKSTFAERLSTDLRAPYFNLDAWMVNLFRPDRPTSGAMEWYIERKQRCIEQIWRVAQSILDADCDVILELGLIQRADRNAFYRRIGESGHELQIYILDAAKEIRRTRVQQRNLQKGTTFSMAVPDEVFEMASNLWQPPDEFECQEQDIEFVETDDGN